MKDFLSKGKSVVILFVGMVLLALEASAQAPSNHVTNFTASALNSSDIQVTWNGSAGPTLPVGYVVLARKTGGTFATITDGTPVADDTDFTDANTNGALNTVHTGGGGQVLHTVTFTGLLPET